VGSQVAVVKAGSPIAHQEDAPVLGHCDTQIVHFHPLHLCALAVATLDQLLKTGRDKGHGQIQPGTLLHSGAYLCDASQWGVMVPPMLVADQQCVEIRPLPIPQVLTLDGDGYVGALAGDDDGAVDVTAHGHPTRASSHASVGCG
jgi:hypothetical protein